MLSLIVSLTNNSSFAFYSRVCEITWTLLFIVMTGGTLLKQATSQQSSLTKSLKTRVWNKSCSKLRSMKLYRSVSFSSTTFWHTNKLRLIRRLASIPIWRISCSIFISNFWSSSASLYHVWWSSDSLAGKYNSDALSTPRSSRSWRTRMMQHRCSVFIALTVRISSRISAKLIRTSESSKSLMNGWTTFRRCQSIAFVTFFITLSNSRAMLLSFLISQTTLSSLKKSEVHSEERLSKLVQIMSLLVFMVMLQNRLVASMIKHQMAPQKCSATKVRLV